MTEQLTQRRLVLRALVHDDLLDPEMQAAALELLRVDLPPGPYDVASRDWSKHDQALAWTALRQKLAHDASAALDVF